jgi:hypothetical protein
MSMSRVPFTEDELNTIVDDTLWRKENDYRLTKKEIKARDRAMEKVRLLMLTDDELEQEVRKYGEI